MCHSIEGDRMLASKGAPYCIRLTIGVVVIERKGGLCGFSGTPGGLSVAVGDAAG